MTRKQTYFLLTCISAVLVMIFISCSSSQNQPENKIREKETSIFVDGTETIQVPFVCIIDTPNCTDAGCTGTYKGVEFIDPDYIEDFKLNGTDVAHQYSNKMCEYVGKRLKYLYTIGQYSKVDFSKIKMQTIGMDEGKNYVEYRVEIPFKRVPKEQATTGFDHCGGWGHTPEIKKRKFDLIHSSKKIVKNYRLEVSRLMKTKEGLEEYWIQWQHTDYQ